MLPFSGERGVVELVIVFVGLYINEKTSRKLFGRFSEKVTKSLARWLWRIHLLDEEKLPNK
jgi:hypothetical protein